MQTGIVFKLYENKVFMKQITLLTAIIFSYSVNYAQIISDNKVESRPKTEKSGNIDSTWNNVGDIWITRGVGYQLPESKVKTTNNAFGKPLGTREFEKMENRFTFHLGMREQVNKFLTVEAGVQIDRYGQSYHFDHPTTDSMYNYVRDYTFIGIPIQTYFTTGKRWKFYIGVGVQPMLIMRNRLETIWQDSLGNKYESNVNKKETMNFLNLSLIGSAGISFQINQSISMYFFPSYQLGVTSIYGKQAPHQEWLSGLNFKFGLGLNPTAIAGKWKKNKMKQ